MIAPHPSQHVCDMCPIVSRRRFYRVCRFAARIGYYGTQKPSSNTEDGWKLSRASAGGTPSEFQKPVSQSHDVKTGGCCVDARVDALVGSRGAHV